MKQMRVAKATVIIIVTWLVILPFGLAGQTFTERPGKPVNPEFRWKKMRTAGIVLTSLGVVCEAAAITLYVDGRRQYERERSGEVMPKHAPLNRIVGEMGIYGGALALAGGITSYLIGNSKLKKIRHIAVQSGPESVNIVYRF